MSPAANRQPQGGRWLDLARAAAGEEESSRDVGFLQELLALVLEGDLYAIPVERVREIVRPRPITPMPGVPHEVLGVVALRGQMLQVLDLRARLGLPSRAATRSSRMVILHGQDGDAAGVLVDAVVEVLRVAEQELSPLADAPSRCVTALCSRDERFVSVLDVDRLLQIDTED